MGFIATENVVGNMFVYIPPPFNQIIFLKPPQLIHTNLTVVGDRNTVVRLDILNVLLANREGPA